VVVDPRLCKQDYVVDIEDAEVAILDIRDTGKVLIYSIVVVPEDLSKMTANLKAPVLINTENNKGKQVILNNEDYPIKYYILQQLQKTGG
jgi:flagellar assembly factor FliW